LSHLSAVLDALFSTFEMNFSVTGDRGAFLAFCISGVAKAARLGGKQQYQLLGIEMRIGLVKTADVVCISVREGSD
jgi:hypothetical protein